MYQHVTVGSVADLDVSELDHRQKALRLKLHETIRKVSDDIGRRYTFNTAIAAVMELMNELAKFQDESVQGRGIMQEALDNIVLMLAPIVPHISHRLWQALGHDTAIVDETWPAYDESALVQDSIELVVQVNGKLRGHIQVPAEADKETIEQLARANDNVQAHIADKALRKVIVVPGRLVNLVVG